MGLDVAVGQPQAPRAMPTFVRPSGTGVVGAARPPHPPLDTLLLALPIAWKGTLTQYAGRLSRVADGKHDARIYDYPDTRVPVLARMYGKRERVYRSLGYEFGAMLEASDDEDHEGSGTFLWPEPR